MKKIIVTLFLLSSFLFSEAVYSGADGYIAQPKADVSDDTAMGISLRYSHSGIITPSLYFVPFKNFQIYGGYDIDTVNNPEHLLLTGIQYEFYDKKVHSGMGITFEVPLEKNLWGAMDIYWNIGHTLLNYDVTFGLGYTIGFGLIPAGQHFTEAINFYIGFERGIIIPEKIFIYGDFANYPYRHFDDWGINHPEYARESRGIANLGINFRLVEWLSLSIAGLDIFDQNRSLSLAASFNIDM